MNSRSIFVLLFLSLIALAISGWVHPYLLHTDENFLEEFNQFDFKRWTSTMYDFDGNASVMTPEALSFEGSHMKLMVDVNAERLGSSSKPFTGGGILSNQYYQYGNFSVRTKQDIKPGTVSSCFLIGTTKNENENRVYEIEMKFLGKDEGQVQFVIQYFDEKGKSINHQDTYNLGFNFRKKFHEYGIVWEEHAISFYVDRRLAKKYDVTITQAMQLGVNHWVVGENQKWAGAMDAGLLPSIAFYDFIDYISI